MDFTNFEILSLLNQHYIHSKHTARLLQLNKSIHNAIHTIFHFSYTGLPFVLWKKYTKQQIYDKKYSRTVSWTKSKRHEEAELLCFN